MPCYARACRTSPNRDPKVHPKGDLAQKYLVDRLYPQATERSNAMRSPHIAVPGLILACALSLAGCSSAPMATIANEDLPQKGNAPPNLYKRLL